MREDDKKSRRASVSSDPIPTSNNGSSVRRISSINSLLSVVASTRRLSNSSLLSSGGEDDWERDLEAGRGRSYNSFAHLEVQTEFEDSHSKAFKTAIENAGRNAFGIIAIDVWIHDEDDGSFHQPPGGWWRHHLYQPESVAAQRALARIEDTSHSDYAPPLPQIAGAGLAGYFWSLIGAHNRHCIWRDVKAITSDPDQPPYLRMQLLEQAGFGKATGVPFDIRGHRGVVVYLSRESASLEQLEEKANDAHLRVSSDLIGVISANSITQEASIGVKTTRTAATLCRIRAKWKALYSFSAVPAAGKEKTEEEEEDEYMFMSSRYNTSFRRTKKFIESFDASFREGLGREIINGAKHKGYVTAKKCKGGGLQPPPPMLWEQTAWVFFGAFATLTILAGLSNFLMERTGYSIVLGPFGALMTLQYGLTPAPASQPRNAIYGQTIAISIALLVKLVPTEIITSWLKPPIATALAVATMAKMGIIHPPAGASAALFSATDRLDGVFFALMLLGNVIAILTAIFINNINDKKQYPIYYAFVPESWTKWLVSNALKNFAS